MIEAAQRCGKSCVIGFQGCWSDVFLQLRQMICAGQLGAVRSVRAAGAGAEARKVMGMAVFSGMLVATILAAQCTDQQATKVTTSIYRCWRRVGRA
jgi:predicted dehydrogenase